MNLTHRRLAVRMSAVALALSIGVSTGSAAMAGSREPQDVSSIVLSNVSTISPSTMSVKTTREADYTVIPAVFIYTTSVEGLGSAENSACTLTLNGATFSEGTCWTLVGFGVTDLTQSGNYVLSTGSTVLATWTFTNPNEAPPVLAPAQCKITSIKYGKSTKSGTTFTVATNGKCTSGSWLAWSNAGSFGFDAEKKKTFKFKQQYVTNKEVPLRLKLTFTPTEDFEVSTKSIKVK